MVIAVAVDLFFHCFRGAVRLISFLVWKNSPLSNSWWKSTVTSPCRSWKAQIHFLSQNFWQSEFWAHDLGLAKLMLSLGILNLELVMEKHTQSSSSNTHFLGARVVKGSKARGVGHANWYVQYSAMRIAMSLLVLRLTFACNSDCILSFCSCFPKLDPSLAIQRATQCSFN